jgi:hypothetical protein
MKVKCEIVPEFKCHIVETCGRVEERLQRFLTAALDEDVCSDTRSGYFAPRKKASGGWEVLEEVQHKYISALLRKFNVPRQ